MILNVHCKEVKNFLDYIYGEINQKVEKNVYHGANTNTAEVVVDNVNNTISVNAHADSSYVEDSINKALNKLNFYTGNGSKKFVKDVSQENGKINVRYEEIDYNDLPTLSIDDIVNLRAALQSKQSSLTFKGDEDSGVITNEYFQQQISKLEGSLKYLGESDTDPRSGIVSINGKVITPQNGNTVTFNNSKLEFVYVDNDWVLRRDDSQYIEKDKEQIKNIDISKNAQIEPSKILGLRGNINNPGYLDKLDTLLGDSNGSVQEQIQSAIQDLDVNDTAIPKEFITFVKQTDGKISVGRQRIKSEDVPIIETWQVANLDDHLNYLKNKALSSSNYPKFVDYDANKIIYAIYLDSTGQIQVATKSITTEMLPNNIPYFKIEGLAPVAITNNYNDLIDKPKINIDLSQHYIEFINL